MQTWHRDTTHRLCRSEPRNSNPNIVNQMEGSQNNYGENKYNQEYQDNIPKRSLEDTLQAFMQTQAQINQNTMQALQDLKNSVDRIEAQLNAEEEEEFSRARMGGRVINISDKKRGSY